MSSGLQRCRRCGAQVIVANVFGGDGRIITLDQRPVVGGSFRIWAPDSKLVVADKRPAQVGPPLNPHTRKPDPPPGWDPYLAADERQWHVQHRHREGGL